MEEIDIPTILSPGKIPYSALKVNPFGAKTDSTIS